MERLRRSNNTREFLRISNYERKYFIYFIEGASIEIQSQKKYVLFNVKRIFFHVLYGLWGALSAGTKNQY